MGEWMSGMMTEILSDCAKKPPGELHFVRGLVP